jgi:hypothetical protein
VLNIKSQIIIAALFTLISAIPAKVSYAPTGDILELIDVTRIPYLKDSQSIMMSSYDRTGGNDDGFEKLGITGYIQEIRISKG